MGASEKEIKRRCDAIREKMKEEGFKALAVFSQVQLGHAGAVRYISNYHLDSRKEYLIFPLLMGDPWLIVPMQNQLFSAKSNSWIKEVRSGEEMGGMVQGVANVIKMLKLENEAIGIVGLINTIPFNDYQLLTRELPNAHFKDATELLDGIRMVKSPEEIDMIQQTTDIADYCY